jgi:Putative peptidoglycan binding domain.
MVRLLALWQPDAQLPASGPVCPALAKWKLECLHGQGDWSDLEHLDLPAILTLHRNDGTPRYVVLRHLDDQYADLTTQDGDIRFARDRLRAVWNGEYVAVWRNPVGLHPFGVGTRGDAVLWLRGALDTAEGRRPSPSPSPTFDDDLKQRLMRFQRTHQLTPDGLVGTQTLIVLIHAGAHPGPLLMPSGDGGTGAGSTAESRS